MEGTETLIARASIPICIAVGKSNPGKRKRKKSTKILSAKLSSYLPGLRDTKIQTHNPVHIVYAFAREVNLKK